MLVSLNDFGTSVPLLQRNIKGDENFNLQKNYKKKKYGFTRSGKNKIKNTRTE